MPQHDYTIRPMTRAEVDIAVEWAAAEGWNPGRHDAECYFAADPHGFLVGLLDGAPIACISAVRYGPAFGFLGFYIVKAGYRGRGFGLRIWNAALEYLQGCNIGLDGVVAQQDNYRKSGFTRAYRNARYQGIGGGELPAGADIVALDALAFAEVDAYDRPFFPAARPAFTRLWIAQADAHALGLRRDGRLVGYGVIRGCRNGFKIGPLFADVPADADTLLRALKAQVPATEAVFLDVPQVNPDAVQLAEGHGMEIVFETARMYTGAAPALPLARTYGVASFEIG